jgi:hypothetical protein
MLFGSFFNFYNLTMKKSIFKILSILMVSLVIFSCRDREPASRYKLADGTYSVNCINCKTYGTPATTHNYTSIRTSFNVTKGHMSKVGTDSYLKVTYLFDNGGGSSSFIESYKSLTIASSNITFDSDWAWGGTNSFIMTIELYTGRGMKSEPLTITITRPAGAN